MRKKRKRKYGIFIEEDLDFFLGFFKRYFIVFKFKNKQDTNLPNFEQK